MINDLVKWIAIIKEYKYGRLLLNKTRHDKVECKARRSSVVLDNECFSCFIK